MYTSWLLMDENWAWTPECRTILKRFQDALLKTFVNQGTLVVRWRKFKEISGVIIWFSRKISVRIFGVQYMIKAETRTGWVGEWEKLAGQPQRRIIKFSMEINHRNCNIFNAHYICHSSFVLIVTVTSTHSRYMLFCLIGVSSLTSLTWSGMFWKRQVTLDCICNGLSFSLDGPFSFVNKFLKSGFIWLDCLLLVVVRNPPRHYQFYCKLLASTIRRPVIVSGWSSYFIFVKNHVTLEKVVTNFIIDVCNSRQTP